MRRIMAGRRGGAAIAGFLLGVGLTGATPAHAAAVTSFWAIHNWPVAGPSLCITATAQDGRATAGPCDGGARQDWAFVNGSGGEFLVSRGLPGYVLAVESVDVGAHLTVKRLDPADGTQVFVAGDPVARHRNHIRPRDAGGLCLEMRPSRAKRPVVVLARCESASVGGQAWLSTFTGNH
jgi:hypothetical protein